MCIMNEVTAYLSVCLSVCLYVCMNVCMYVCISKHIYLLWHLCQSIVLPRISILILHFRMARPCKFCGVFFQDSEELEFHEHLHRDLDFLNGNVSDVAFQVVHLSIYHQTMNAYQWPCNLR